MSLNIGGGELKELKPRILVLGVGGAGGNAINAMIRILMRLVTFPAAFPALLSVLRNTPIIWKICRQGCPMSFARRSP